MTAADAYAREEGGSSPGAIREQLLPEEVGDFDREYRQAMAEATESLDLTPVLAMLERWRRVAVSSREPAVHRQMLRSAEELRRGTRRAEPWHEARRRLGL